MQVSDQGRPGLSRKPHGPRQQTRLRRPWTRGGAKARWQSDRRLRPPTAGAFAACVAHQGRALSYVVPLPQVRTQARSAGDQTFFRPGRPPHWAHRSAPPPHVPGAAPREESAGKNPNGTPQSHSRTRLGPIHIQRARCSGPNLKAPLSRRRFSSPCNINTAPFPRHLPQ